MKRKSFVSVCWQLIVLIGVTGSLMVKAQSVGNTHAVSASNLPPAEIIRRFTAKESELAQEWHEFIYQKEITLQVLGPAKTVTGEFYQVSEFVFDDRGKRVERIIKAPPSTLDRAGLIMTAEDRNALINLVPFALTQEELPNYQVTYVGKEKIDELNTYVFDVTPKAMLDQRELKRLKDQKIEGRYFQGRIWVDDADLQIVKSAGKVVPEFKQRFPRFETYRENIFEHYWLPTYTWGEDTLEFDKFKIDVRQIVKFTKYRRFQSDIRIGGDVEDVPPDDDTSGKGQNKAKVIKPEKH